MIKDLQDYTPLKGAEYIAIFPTRDLAVQFGEVLGGRGFRMVAIRLSEWARFEPGNFWYEKPARRPQYEGWWQVFGLDVGPYPQGNSEEWWRIKESDFLQVAVEELGGDFEGNSEGDLNEMMRRFNRRGLVHDVDQPHQRIEALGGL